MINRLFAIAWLVACLVAQADAQSAAAFPKGDIKGPFVWKSTIYPGTERDYWVYVPKQYDAAKPACTMIVQDGLSRANGWKLPTVLDSLIALKEIPVIIGIFIDHGKVPAAGVDNWPRFNRSFEYDALGDRYARFLIEEIIPEVSKTYNLSKDPNDRSIAGASSGAICAFNAAWERPNEFRRVLSTIGTYVGLRGGDEFPTLVRKTEPKPLRVFLEDGSGDLNIYGGDWWTANQAMLSALTWAGYEVNHAWGTEGHNSKGAVKILPEALKWLWKDYPQPVKTHASPVQRFNPLVEGEEWNEIETKAGGAGELAISKGGDAFWNAGTAIYRWRNRSITRFSQINVSGLSFGPEDKLYAYDPEQSKIIAIGETGKPTDIVTNVTSSTNLVVTERGIYFTSDQNIGYYSFATKTKTFWPVSVDPKAVGVTADQTFLIVLTTTQFGYSLKIAQDGSVNTAQEYIHFHIPYGDLTSTSYAITADSENRTYTATSMGIQVADQLGRINFIIAKPSEELLFDVKFGGPDLSILFATTLSGKIYARKLSTKGVLPFLPPVKPPKPGL